MFWGRPRACIVMFAAVGMGCSDPDRGIVNVLPGGHGATGDVQLLVSAPADGDRVWVTVATDGLGALGMDGQLTWDPRRLTYVGQAVTLHTASVVNESGVGRGVLVYQMLDPTNASDRESVFAFERQAGGTRPDLTLDVALLVTEQGVRRSVRAVSTHFDDAGPSGIEPVKLAWSDWAEFLAPVAAARVSRHGPAAVPGAGFRFGDANLDGVINVLDALYTSNVSVGNTVIAECIVGTDSPSRDCIAANVRPANLPGLGEVGDPCPPGLDVCGVEGRTINVLDALAISQESVGLDQPIVGEAIPGSALAPADTVALPSVVTGILVLSSDTLYVLGGTVEVGDASGLAGELRVAAGTRIAALPGAGLHVTRNGRIHAEGTQFEPVTFACFGAPSTGCWRGLTIDGNALVNTGAIGSAGVPGRSPGGCLQAEDFGDWFGGCEDADSSGVLRFVRIQHAGFAGHPGIDFRGVGSKTVVEHVYVASSQGVGIGIRGGSVRLKRLRISGAGTVGLDWTLGWRGALQFAVVQTVSSGLVAIRGRNSVADHDASPRSAPVLRNVTIVGPPDPGSQGAGSGGVLLEAGTDAVVRSSLALAQPLATSHLLDVNDAATWARVDAGAVRFDSSLIAGYARMGALDADPPTLAGYDSPDAEGRLLRDPAAGNAIVMTPATVESVLRAPWASVPDLRPDPFGPPASLTQSCPPSAPDTFFEWAPYCGAVGVPSNTTGEIPWFEPAPLFDMTRVPASPAPGLLVVRVETAAGVPIPGVSINGGSLTTFGITGLDGTYRSYTTPGGSAFTLGNLPPGCSFHDLIVYAGPSAGSTFFAVERIPC